MNSRTINTQQNTQIDRGPHRVLQVREILVHNTYLLLRSRRMIGYPLEYVTHAQPPLVRLAAVRQ